MREQFFYPPRIFGAVPAPAANFETSKVIILPIPYDSTAEYKSGARSGPQAIIDASQELELYDPELDQEIYRVGIHTLPEVQPLMSGPEQMIDRVYQVARDLVHQDKILAMLGGEHSLTLGMVRAFQEKWQNLSVLHLDAHADLRDSYLGTKYSHACVMRRVWESCPMVQVGIRSLSWEEHQFLEQHRLKPFFAHDLASPDVAEKVVSALSQEVYITIDLDVLDPSIMPAVGFPEPGGMTWQEVTGLLRTVARNKHIVGFDLVELCPREGPTACAFLAAKLAYKLIGYATSSLK